MYRGPVLALKAYDLREEAYILWIQMKASLSYLPLPSLASLPVRSQRRVAKAEANYPIHTREAMVTFPNPPGICTCQGGIVEEPGMLQERGRGVRGREDAYNCDVRSYGP